MKRRRRVEDGTRRRRKRKTLETKVFWNGVEGVHVDPNGEGHHERRGK